MNSRSGFRHTFYLTLSLFSIHRVRGECVGREVGEYAETGLAAHICLQFWSLVHEFWDLKSYNVLICVVYNRDQHDFQSI